VRPLPQTGITRQDDGRSVPDTLQLIDEPLEVGRSGSATAAVCCTGSYHCRARCRRAVSPFLCVSRQRRKGLVERERTWTRGSAAEPQAWAGADNQQARLRVCARPLRPPPPPTPAGLETTTPLRCSLDQRPLAIAPPPSPPPPPPSSRQEHHSTTTSFVRVFRRHRWSPPRPTSPLQLGPSSSPPVSVRCAASIRLRDLPLPTQPPSPCAWSAAQTRH
jgi:hypothetical protein